MAIDSQQGIEDQNQMIKEDHAKAFQAWNQKPGDSQGKKPRIKPTICQTLACYCGVQNCI
jgi:hypothetical protein